MTTELPAVGTLYVARNGDAYRLRTYGVDWRAEPFTGEHTIPRYSIAYVDGGFSSSDELPEGARVAWTPVSAQGDS